MINFPLYTSLLKGLTDKDLTTANKADLIKKINKMDDNGHELVYALIKIYYIEHTTNDHSILSVPYGGKCGKNEMNFVVDELPNLLKQLVYKFCKVHIKHMKEDLKHTNRV